MYKNWDFSSTCIKSFKVWNGPGVNIFCYLDQRQELKVWPFRSFIVHFRIVNNFQVSD